MGRLIFVFIVLIMSNFALADGKKMKVKIDGMTCPSCAASIEVQFNKLNEISNVDISITKGTATITLKDGKTVSEEVIKDAVKKAGYKVTSIEPNT